MTFNNLGVGFSPVRHPCLQTAIRNFDLNHASYKGKFVKVFYKLRNNYKDLHLM